MTEFELLEELAKELYLPDIEDVEVTAATVAEYTGVSTSQAMRMLKAKEQAGLLKSRMVKMPNSHPARAFRKAA